MKKRFGTLLAILLVFVPIAVLATDSTEDNFQTAKNQISDSLKELKEAKGTRSNGGDSSIYREKGSAYSEYKTSGLGPDYYAKTAESPYTKSKIAQGIAQIAATAAAAIGTSMQGSSATQLKTMAADLQASGVPEYQAMATQLVTEAKYIDNGDSISANKVAENIATYAATELPVDTNYTPTASEQAALNPFAEFFKGFLSSILSVLSSNAISILTTTLGTILGGPVGTALGGSLGGIVNALAQSLINNTPLDAASLGATAATGVNSVITNSASTASSAIKNSATPSASTTSSSSSSSTESVLPAQKTGSEVPIQKSGTDKPIFQ